MNHPSPTPGRDSNFDELVKPHRTTLRLHCYRMLGSSHDSDDMLQETLTRAFRSLHTLEDRSLVRPWLYRIATNVCLDELSKRPPDKRTRARGPELGPPGDPANVERPRLPDDEWIEPSPSAWLGDDASSSPSPDAQYTLKESVALAFVAALQILTPPQRAVLLLRDVVGLSAEETAVALECSVSAANSTLHRARAAIEERVGPRADWSPEKREPVDRALLERYMRAWQSGDLATIISLLHEEVSLSMPPVHVWFQGKRDVQWFFENQLRKATTQRLFRVRVVEVAGSPGIAFYRIPEPGDTEAGLFAIQVFEWKSGKVHRIDHFMTPGALEAFGLPQKVPA